MLRQQQGTAIQIKVPLFLRASICGLDIKADFLIAHSGGEGKKGGGSPAFFFPHPLSKNLHLGVLDVEIRE